MKAYQLKAKAIVSKQEIAVGSQRIKIGTFQGQMGGDYNKRNLSVSREGNKGYS